ncbi:MAG: class I SAM-dependent methyltransferase [Gammaproteobacteria bacterium]|nr:class I SAM-dependent methyltransferase [Gammaproteobacteria bacterium]NNF59860.1 methyltransferase domain-containing protein [Gammaproteobacteria bacterium]NNM21499.1 methyltransferase domain-containing protein [Gammaproteobacteria bacterium]
MGKKNRKQKEKARKKSRLTASSADRHLLYEESVQNVEEEIKFLDKAYRDLRGRPALTLREDFAGTTAAACEWVANGDERRAWAVDFDPEVLNWGRQRHVQRLSVEQQQRIELIEGDVRNTNTPLADLIIAFNFSYFVFKTRDELRGYFEQARRNLQPDGLFMIDCFGGSEALEEVEEETEQDEFTYVWDQDSYDPISAQMQCHIHFHFPDGTRMREAFSYEWRLWTLPELRELLHEAGFRTSTVYWEGSDEDGEGNDEYEPVERGDADPAWIAYVVAER